MTASSFSFKTGPPEFRAIAHASTSHRSLSRGYSCSYHVLSGLETTVSICKPSASTRIPSRSPARKAAEGAGQRRGRGKSTAPTETLTFAWLRKCGPLPGSLLLWTRSSSSARASTRCSLRVKATAQEPWEKVQRVTYVVVRAFGSLPIASFSILG
jgi:hypothetical protein